MDGSIRDIVYHLTGDKLVQLNHAFGDGTLDWTNLDIQKADKSEMMKQLGHAHVQLIWVLEGQKDEDLKAKVATWGGTRMAAEDFFLMLIEHDIYHAGQIRYIRNVAG